MPSRAGTLSASIHSASSCGSSRQCELSRAPVASLRNAGENSTAFTRSARLCRSSKLPRKLVVGPAAQHKFDFVMRPQSASRFSMQNVSPSPESGHFTSTILMHSRRNPLQRPLSAGLEQHLIAVVQQTLHQRHHFPLLQHGLAAGNLNQTAAGLRRRLRPALPQRPSCARPETCIRCRTTNTADCIPSAAQTHKAGPRIGRLALNRFVDFSDLHGIRAR